MQTLQCIELSGMTLSPTPEQTVLCLGNFDGVHIAHRQLIKNAILMRNNHFPHAACGVFCFIEPSSNYLSANPAQNLCTLNQKLSYFRELGMEYAFIAHFPFVRNLQPVDFVNSILKEAFHCVAAVCGFNYRFGKNGQGTPDLLEKTLQSKVWVQEEIKIDGETVSSTRIRQLLLSGDVEKAARLLARPYVFASPVVHGKKLGKKLGAATANQYFPDKMLIPKYGVYATDCVVDGKHYKGISNIGVRPTVDRTATANCETHLLNFSGDLYEKEVMVHFLKRIRDEIKFSSETELQNQIRLDIETVKSMQ